MPPAAESAAAWTAQWIGSADGVITFEQMLVRAVVVFLIGLTLIRLATPRIFSSKATPLDIILSVIIGSNLSRTLTGNAPFFEVIAVTVLLVLLHAFIAKIAARFRSVANLVKGKPLELVRNGEVDEDAMARAAVGARDLEAALRDAGGKEIEEIELAVLERGGDIDVILRDS